MRDIEGCDVGAAVNLFHFVAHVLPECGIKVADWFVKEQHTRFNHQCACESDALLLSAGERVDGPVAVFCHLHHLQHFGDFLLAFPLL